MVKLDDAIIYSHKQSLTKLLQEIELDYEYDFDLQSADNLHMAMAKLRNEMFLPDHGGRQSVPHIGAYIANIVLRNLLVLNMFVLLKILLVHHSLKLHYEPFCELNLG